jgi:hypothetical protein
MSAKLERMISLKGELDRVIFVTRLAREVDGLHVWRPSCVSFDSEFANGRHDFFCRVTQRSMADVMKERSQSYYLSETGAHYRSRKFEIAKNRVESSTGQVHDPERMKVAIMSGSRETELGKSQLLDGPKTLKLTGVEHRDFG